MSEALDTWRRKLAHLQQEEAIAADAGQKFAIAEQIREAKTKIVELESGKSAPDETAPRFRTDISRIIGYAPADLIGRDDEKKLLSEAWAKAVRAEQGRPHIFTFVALGGEGKTSLVAKWAVDEMLAKGWPGCDAAFAWSFYSQGTREQVAASSDLFLKEALVFFGDDADREFAASSAGAFEKGQRLARIVGQRRSLLILDGLEPLQYAPTSPTPGELKDQGIAALLKGLAGSSRGLCVVTTRYSLPDLKAFRQTTAPEVKLLRLSREAGVHLLQSFGVNGSLLRNIPFDGGREMVNEFEKLVEDVKGHALTLNLLGTYLRDAHGGDIRKRDLVRLEEADGESDHPNHAFHVMDAYVLWFETGGKNEDENRKGLRALALLRLLGLFDRPASADCLQALWTGDVIPNLTEPLAGLSDAQRNVSLARLEAAKLLTVNRDASGALVALDALDALDAHPHLREYFAKQLREQSPEAWRAAHRRLYEHLCATTKEGDQPTLEDLQPLYQAVAHGCQAGLQQEACDEVYGTRILRVPEYYSSKKLGALGFNLGAVACFFESPWRRVSLELTEGHQASLLNEAAYYLRASGRLTEAIEPMRTGLEKLVSQQTLNLAAAMACSLSELELVLGEVAAALRDAKQSVTYADRSGDVNRRFYTRATHADALHHVGRRAEAETCFREAEAQVAEHQPEYPLLFSVQGFRYCDLLLAGSERAAWQRIIHSDFIPRLASLFTTCRAVSERAAQTLRESEEYADASLLDIALDHLTLGRTALYEAILGEFDIRDSILELDLAVSGLRRAGAVEFVVLGLLTRAWLRFLTGARTGPASAQEDLDEAWEIAERGPMKLHLTDIHLHRARLFFREAKYPWDQHPDGSPRGPKDDLAAAKAAFGI